MNDYKFDEFVGKNGNPYAILDFQSWIEDHDHYETNDHIVTQCPHCLEAYKTDKSYEGPYIKLKLYITSDLSKGFCFRCNTAFFSPHIDSEDLTKEQLMIVPKFISNFDPQEYDFEMKDEKWQLSNYTELEDKLSNNHIRLIYQRNPYLLNLYKELGLRTFNDRSVAIPFYFKGDLVYFQLWRKDLVPKYYNPPIMTKPLYICGEVKNKAIIVEGTFDAMACRILYPEYTPIAVLGSTITKAQIMMLREFWWDEIKIFLDKSQLSYKVANKLRHILDMTEFSIVESDGEDPEELLRRLISTQNVS
jgi:hypothetical protein